MNKGDKVLVRPAGFPGQVFPGVIVAAGRRPGFFKVRYYSFGVFFAEVFGPAAIEKIDDFGQFYQPGVVRLLEQHLVKGA